MRAWNWKGCKSFPFFFFKSRYCFIHFSRACLFVLQSLFLAPSPHKSHGTPMAPKGGIVEGRAKPKSLLPSPMQAVKLKRGDSSHMTGGDRITLPLWHTWGWCQADSSRSSQAPPAAGPVAWPPPAWVASHVAIWSSSHDLCFVWWGSYNTTVTSPGDQAAP